MLFPVCFNHTKKSGTVFQNIKVFFVFFSFYWTLNPFYSKIHIIVQWYTVIGYIRQILSFIIKNPNITKRNIQWLFIIATGLIQPYCYSPKNFCKKISSVTNYKAEKSVVWNSINFKFEKNFFQSFFCKFGVFSFSWFVPMVESKINKIHAKN